MPEVTNLVILAGLGGITIIFFFVILGSLKGMLGPGENDNGYFDEDYLIAPYGTKY